jgi:hypothetical protein
VRRPHDYRVYLSSTADTLSRQKRRLAAVLESHGLHVVGVEPPIPPPYEREKHARALADVLREVDLSVHLLDGFPGAPVEGAPGLTYPMEQCRLALQVALEQLVVHPEFFDAEIEQIDEPVYRQFLDDLRKGTLQRGAPGSLEIAHVREGQIVELVLARYATARRKREQAVGPVFLDLHPDDQSAVGSLVGFLSDRQLSLITMPDADLAPAQAGSLFEQNLVRASTFIIVYGRVARDWVKARLERALQLIVRHDLQCKPSVYLVAPDKGAHERQFRFCEVIDNVRSFDPAPLVPLLPRSVESVG